MGCGRGMLYDHFQAGGKKGWEGELGGRWDIRRID